MSEFHYDSSGVRSYTVRSYKLPCMFWGGILFILAVIVIIGINSVFQQPLQGAAEFAGGKVESAKYGWVASPMTLFLYNIGVAGVIGAIIGMLVMVLLPGASASARLTVGAIVFIGVGLLSLQFVEPIVQFTMSSFGGRSYQEQVVTEVPQSGLGQMAVILVGIAVIIGIILFIARLASYSDADRKKRQREEYDRMMNQFGG